MWKAQAKLVQPGVSKISILPDDVDQPLSFLSFFELCGSEEAFGDFVSDQLLSSGYPGFFWELPQVTEGSLDSPFECVVVDGPVLRSLNADPQPFSNQFSTARAGETVIVFENLSGDATLISPIPLAEDLGAYPHLAAFLREAPQRQLREFWSALGRTALNCCSNKPFWLSTAGLGVSWLHLRFDSRPKYYRYQPYKAM